jgi:hypothetical protein
MKESEVQRYSVMSTRQAGTAASRGQGPPSLRMAKPPQQTGTTPQSKGAPPLGPGASRRDSGPPWIGPGGAPPHGPGPGVPPAEEMAAWTVEEVVLMTLYLCTSLSFMRTRSYLFL